MRSLVAVAVGSFLAAVFAGPVPAQIPETGCPVGAVVCQTSTGVEATPLSLVAKPVSETGRSEINVTYTYPPTAPTTSPTAITLSFSGAPAWAVATLAPPEVTVVANATPTPPATNSTSNALATLNVSFTGEAPAYTPATILVTAQARENGQLANSSGQTEVEVQAGYAPSLRATADRSSVSLAPGETETVVVTLTNDGNGPTRVTPSVSGARGGIDVTLPSASTLGSRQAGGGQTMGTMTISLAAAADAAVGTTAATFSFRAEFSGTPPAGITPATDKRDITVSVTVTGEEGGGEDGGEGEDGTPPPPQKSPGPELAAIAAAVLVTGAASRRRE